jgi:hypothetical protein
LFSDAPVQRKLLSYLAEKAFEGASDDLKEYAIGVELFQKPEAYSPQIDPSVRVHTTRLRNRLEEYFRTEGADSEIILKLPKGSFTIVFGPRHAEAEVKSLEPVPSAESSAGPPVIPPAPASRRWPGLLFALVLAGFLAIIVYQGVEIHSIKQEIAHRRLDPAVERLWRPLLDSPRPLVLVIGMPLWLRLRRGYFRDSDVNSPADIPNSAVVQELFGLAGEKPVRVEYGFNGLGETLQSFLLGRLFLAAQKPVTVARSNTLSWEELRSQDAVLLGSSKSNPHLRDLSFLVNYRLVPGWIQVLHPRKGEPERYQPTLNAQEETIADYAIVARLPGIGGNGYIMVLGAESTAGNWAAAELMTDPRQAREIVKRMANASGELPEFFELILRAEFRSLVPVKIEYVTHRVVPRQTANP